MEVIYGGIQFKDNAGQIHSTMEEFNCFTFTARNNDFEGGDDGVGVWDYYGDKNGRWIIRIGDRREPGFRVLESKGVDETITDFMRRVEQALGYEVKLEGLYDETDHFWGEW